MKNIDTEHCQMLIDGEILRVIYKPGKIDIREAREIVAARKTFDPRQDIRMLVVDQGVTRITRTARNFFASDEGTAGIKAGAFLVSSPLTRVMVNYILKVSKPKVPARMFTNEDKALVWLKQQ